VEEVLVGTAANLVNDIGLQVNVERARDVFALGRLGEKGGESIVAFGDRAFGDAAVGLGAILARALFSELATTHSETVFDSVELPARVSDLDTGLTDVDRDDLTHGWQQDASECVLTRIKSTTTHLVEISGVRKSVRREWGRARKNRPARRPFECQNLHPWHMLPTSRRSRHYTNDAKKPGQHPACFPNEQIITYLAHTPCLCHITPGCF
jgi:hypothetical protein